MIIRNAKEKDFDNIIESYKALYARLSECGYGFTLSLNDLPDILKVHMDSKMNMVAVAEEANRFCGFISASIIRLDRKIRFEEASHAGMVNELYIVPEERKKGTAKELTLFCEKWLKDNGITIVECNVVAGNHGAFSYWNKQGYRESTKLCYKKL